MKYRNSNEIMGVIVQYLTEHNIPFDIEKKSQNTNYIYDIFLPKGLNFAKRPLGDKYVSLNLNGPTAIEIKGRLLFDTISRYGDLYLELLRQKEVASFLLVYAEGNMPSSTYMYVKRKFGENFHVLSLEQFLGILSSQTTNNIVFTPPTYEWRKDRNKTLEVAKISLSANDFSIFLGAGVSISAKLPSWKDLLAGMMNNSRQKLFEKTDIEQLTTVCYDSSIVMGRFIRMMMEKKSDDERYYQCLHDTLYNGCASFTSPLIDEICSIIASKKEQAQCIITYNYDDIMERALKAKGIENYSVFGQNQPQQMFTIYHVHGFIPYENEEIIKSVPILSEEEYHRVYANSYNWSNVEQIHALSRTTCIFIGLSMTDPNLRRLLDIANKDSEDDPRHFVFLPHIEDFGNNNEADIKNNEAMRIQKEIFLELGLRVIWYEDYNELPKLLNHLHSI